MSFLKSRRRRRLLAKPVPAEWRKVFTRLPFYNRITEQERALLGGHVAIFLAEKHFEAVRGATITNEVALLVAAQACLLLLHRPGDYYPRLRSIIMYPDSFVAPRRERRGSWIESEHDAALSGESWGEGVVVLAWSDVLDSAAREDGRNLVLHEFAHQLDEEDGSANGAPILGDTVYPEQWASVMRTEYDHLRYAAARGEPALLDYYGAESPAEFFAVATETFFERGDALRAEHPSLYNLLRRVYRQDPASWPPLGNASTSQ